MPSTFSLVVAVGNVGSDAEIRFTPQGAQVTTFSIAVDNSYAQNGTRIKRTEWISCEAWGRLAETAGQHVVKGRKVAVEGRLQSEKWEKDGVQHTKTKVVLRNFNIIDWGDKPAGEEEDESLGMPVAE